jgi:predicted membrane-bound spermidine synthase
LSEPVAPALSPPAADRATGSGATAPRVAYLVPLFFLSGGAGLAYEVAWSKRLELTFGTTTHSIGTVLAAYMAGLGLGAWLLGFLADRPGSPARRYAALEAGIGVYGLLAPWVLDGVDWLFVATGGAGGLALKACLGLLAMLPATLLMGGTLPVLARSLVAERSHTQRAVGLLYGINTLGAMAGALLAGLLLVQALGVDATSRWTGGLNLLLAAVALALGPRLAPDVPERPPEPTAVAPPASWLLRVGVWGTFGCGAVALLLEIAWTRALALAFGSSGDAFTIMLAATLAGIGLGSLIAARVARDVSRPLGQLVLALLLLASSCYLFLLGFERLPRFFHVVARSGALTYEELLLVMFATAGAALLPATTALGIAFPLCAQLGTARSRDAGRSVGRVYLANTIGAIAGSLGGGFVLVLALGTGGMIRLGALTAALGATCLALLAAKHQAWSTERARPLALLGAVLAVATLALPAWDPTSLDLDPLRGGDSRAAGQPGAYANRYHGSGAQQVYARDGLNAFVTVRSYGPHMRILRLGGKNDASTHGDMDTQLLLTAVPLLAAPEAKRVLVIGAGSGVSARVAADHPGIEQVDVAELEVAMVEAASEWFDVVNDGVFERDGVEVIYDDARTTLLTGDSTYDVIASEPTNPSIAGVANLFTLEHYQNARRRLTPAGVYAQWIQLYASDDRMARSMLRTFLEAFPHVELWWCNAGDVILLGSQEPLRYDLARVRAAVAGNPGLARDLEPKLACRRPEDLFARFLCTGDELRPLVQRGHILHDRFPQLEGWAARARYQRRGTRALQGQLDELLTRRASAWPPRVHPRPSSDQGLWLARARHHVDHHPPSARLALPRAGHGPEVLALAARLAADPVGLLQQARAEFPHDPVLISELGLALAQAGELQRARQALAELPADAPPSSRTCLAQALSQPPERGEEAAAWALRGVANARSRADFDVLRERLLEAAARAAAQAPQVEATLQALWEEGQREDLALGMFLALAQLQRRRHAECLETLEWLAEEHSASDLLRLRLLRLEAVTASGSAYLADELESFLTDYPHEADADPVQRALRSLTR